MISQQTDGSGDLAQRKLPKGPEFHEVRCSRCGKIVRVCDALNHDMALVVTFCDCPKPATNKILECPVRCLGRSR